MPYFPLSEVALGRASHDPTHEALAGATMAHYKPSPVRLSKVRRIHANVVERSFSVTTGGVGFYGAASITGPPCIRR